MLPLSDGIRAKRFLTADPVWRGRGVLREDGRSVVLVPGFRGGDQTLVVPATWLWPDRLPPGGVRVHSQRRLLRARARAGRAPRRRAPGPLRPARGCDRPQPWRPLRARDARPAALSSSRTRSRCRRCSTAASRPWPRWRRRGALARTGRACREECLTYRCQCTFTDEFFAPFPGDRVRMTSMYSKGDGSCAGRHSWSRSPTASR